MATLHESWLSVVPFVVSVKLDARRQKSIARLDDKITRLRRGDDLGIFRFVMSLHGSELESLPTNLRHNLITKMSDRTWSLSKATHERRALVATLLMVTQPYPKEYEDFENKWLGRFIQTDIFKSLQEEYRQHPDRELSIKRFMDLSHQIAQAHCQTFQDLTHHRWVGLPARHLAYKMSRRTSRRLQKNRQPMYASALHFSKAPDGGRHSQYIGLKNIVDFTTAFNMHRHAGARTLPRLMNIALHENTHFLVESWRAHASSFEMMRTFHMFKSILESESWFLGFLGEAFGYPAYRGTITERMAFSFGLKASTLLQNPADALIREVDYMMLDLAVSRPEWIDILLERVGQMGTKRPIHFDWENRYLLNRHSKLFAA